MKVRDQQKFIAMASKCMPWERQPRETGASFDAFMLYREMGVKRGIAELARMTGKHATLLRRWERQWDWQIRCHAWDDHRQEAYDKAAIEEAKRMGARQAQLGMRLQEVGANRLEQFATTTTLQETLTATDTIRLIKEGADLERVARGEEKGERGGNIIFNLNMKAPPKWAPENVVKSVVEGVAKLVEDSKHAD